MEDLLAIIMVFGTGMIAIVSFSPIGRAIASRILKKDPNDVSPELRDAVEEMNDRLAGLQQQVSELAERQDFTERLLAKVKEKGLPGGGA